jgi:hypothetical protein
VEVAFWGGITTEQMEALPEWVDRIIIDCNPRFPIPIKAIEKIPQWIKFVNLTSKLPQKQMKALRTRVEFAIIAENYLSNLFRQIHFNPPTGGESDTRSIQQSTSSSSSSSPITASSYEFKTSKEQRLIINEAPLVWHGKQPQIR